MTTLIYEGKETSVTPARADQDLWLGVEDLGKATGWEIKPEGACRGEVCVVLPAGELERDGAFNLSGLGRLLGQHELHESAGDVRVFSRSTSQPAMGPGMASDFSLPDLDGRLHSLSEHAGKKVFLVSWASW